MLGKRFSFKSPLKETIYGMFQYFNVEADEISKTADNIFKVILVKHALKR